MARKRRNRSVELKPEELGPEHVVSCTKPGRTCFGKNLFLVNSLSGGRSWMFRYRRNGKERNMGLGAVADVPLDKAREAAARLRDQRWGEERIDPLEARGRSATPSANRNWTTSRSRRRQPSSSTCTRKRGATPSTVPSGGPRSKSTPSRNSGHAPSAGDRCSVDQRHLGLDLDEDPGDGEPRQAAHRARRAMGEGRDAAAHAEQGQACRAPRCPALSGNPPVHGRASPEGGTIGAGSGVPDPVRRAGPAR